MTTMTAPDEPMTTDEARAFGIYLARQERKHIDRRRAAIDRKFGDDADHSRIDAALARVHQFVRWIKGDVSMLDDDNRTRYLPVTYHTALTLHSSVRQVRRKKERLKAKSTFVPEPGRRDSVLDYIERCHRIEAELMAVIETFPEYDDTEWTDDEEETDGTP